MIPEFERYYHELRREAEHDPVARESLDALERTLTQFDVVLNRTATAGLLVLLDKGVGDHLHAFVNLDEPQAAHMMRMFAHFKHLRGQSLPSDSDTPVGLD